MRLTTAPSGPASGNVSLVAFMWSTLDSTNWLTWPPVTYGQSEKHFFSCLGVKHSYGNTRFIHSIISVDCSFLGNKTCVAVAVAVAAPWWDILILDCSYGCPAASRHLGASAADVAQTPDSSIALGVPSEVPLWGTSVLPPKTLLLGPVKNDVST